MLLHHTSPALRGGDAGEIVVVCRSAASVPSGRVQMWQLRILTSFAEERALFRTFAFVASVTIAGLGLASQPATAASFGPLPAVAQAGSDTVTEVQFWEEPRYRNRRSYQERRTYYDYGRPSYGPRRYAAPPDSRQPRNRSRYVAPRRQFVPPVRGCYTPPPMGYRTPRVVCSY